jgi:putative ABC transport system permease protein
VETLLQDARFAIRSLARMRGAAILAIVALSLGIGATTTMFSVVDATLWRPMPLERSDRLAVVSVTKTTARDGLQRLRWSRPGIAELEAATTSFESIASVTLTSITIQILAPSTQHPGLPEQVDGEVVSPPYFKTLRIAPAAGRLFRADEDTTPGAAPVAVISNTMARLRYPDGAVGATIRVNDVPLTIVGVLAPGFRGLSGKSDIWIPRTMAPTLTYSEYLTTPQHFIMVIARLKDGVSFATANAELTAIGDRFADVPSTDDAVWGAVARSLGDARVDTTIRRSGFALLGAAACVLLIGCVNVASLLLARGRTRQREIAVRLAIGSGRWRIVRQLMTEGGLIATAAGVAGVILARWGVAFFTATSPNAVAGRDSRDYASLAAFAEPAIDLRVLGFAVVLAVATTMIFALAPAISAARPDLVPALKDNDRNRSRAFGGLIVAEVALAVLLLVSAGLLLESFAGMQRLRVGFDPDRVVTFWVRPSNTRYATADGPATVHRLLTRIQQTPGVSYAAVNRCTPFYGCARTTVFFPGREIDRTNAPIVGRHYISADYFRALGIRLRSGRVFTPADRAGAPPVAIVNESAARRFWPGENAVGQHAWFGSVPAFQNPVQPVEIVGVVDDVKYDNVETSLPQFYTSFLQFSWPDTMVIVKAQGNPIDLVPSLRAAVAAVDPALPIYDVQMLDARVDEALARPRFNASLIGLFAMAALSLAAIGVYSILSYSVSTRTRELGVRVALGADGGRVISMVLREGLTLAIGGIVFGLAASAATGQLLRGLLFGVTTSDPRLLALGSVLMLIVAALAALIPARRAARVDPMIVLRE